MKSRFVSNFFFSFIYTERFCLFSPPLFNLKLEQSKPLFMKTVIIPVDFSETSLNAARYGADMFAGKAGTSIILYNMFEKDEESETSGQYLESLKAELIEKGVAKVEWIKEEGDDLIDCLGRLAYQKAASLILMGITEKEEWRQLILSSNTVKMAEENICPVMIIPPQAKFNSINNIALTSDFRDVEESTPQLSIKTVLEMFHANLHIVNVDDEHYVSLSERYLTEKDKLESMFKEFNPEFYFIGFNDFFEAIEQFSSDKSIDLLIIISRNLTFVNRVFGTRYTKKLAFQTSIPLLAVHQ